MKTKILISVFLLCILCMPTVSAAEDPDNAADRIVGAWKGTINEDIRDCHVDASQCMEFFPDGTGNEHVWAREISHDGPTRFEFEYEMQFMWWYDADCDKYFYSTEGWDDTAALPITMRDSDTICMIWDTLDDKYIELHRQNDAPCMGGTWAYDEGFSFYDIIWMRVSETLSFTPNHEFRESSSMYWDGVLIDHDAVRGTWETQNGVEYVLTPVESLKGLKDKTPVTVTYCADNDTIAEPFEIGDGELILHKVPSNPRNTL